MACVGRPAVNCCWATCLFYTYKEVNPENFFFSFTKSASFKFPRRIPSKVSRTLILNANLFLSKTDYQNPTPTTHIRELNKVRDS